MANTYASTHINKKDLKNLKISFFNDKNVPISIGMTTLFFKNKEDVKEFMDEIKTSLNL
jgi:hypothetical protein